MRGDSQPGKEDYDVKKQKRDRLLDPKKDEAGDKSSRPLAIDAH
jgi:hypothetical protein